MNIPSNPSTQLNLQDLPPKVRAAARKMLALKRRHRATAKKLERQLTKARDKFTKLERQCDIAARRVELSIQAERRHADQLETAWRPLVLDLHKTCAGTQVNPFDLITQINECAH